ncbi:MAG: coproporphyrinogen III oxidase family protein [Deltaproteobacteria bacterium]|nr:coproporphyrinogen III oxidase family protein [Deltaproteobacteria bacterium]
MDQQQIEKYLDGSLSRTPGTKIQYGHPSPRYWEKSDLDLPDLLAPMRPERQLSLYLHIPFCVPTEPGACGFCLFAREDFESYPLVRRYVDSLVREIERVASLTGRRKVDCVYYGGGTPNLLRGPEIKRIFEAVATSFIVTDDTEITFEGYPPLFTQERLEALAEVGCNRISLGIQTLQPDLLPESGRTQDLAQIESTLRFAADHGMRANVDLITGWFGQTPESIIKDVDTLLDWGATGLVNHPLMIVGDSDFARRAEQLPDVPAQARTFDAARIRLLERGFRMDSYTDYTAPDQRCVRYLELYRDILNTDRIGVGYGANSLIAGTEFAPGSTWANLRSIGAWQAGVDEGRTVIDDRYAFSADDLKVLYLLKGLEGFPWLDAADYSRRFGGDLKRDYAPFWEAFEARGWLRWEGDSPRLRGDGIFYTATVQRVLAEPRVQQLRTSRGMGARSRNPLPVVVRG